MGVKITGQVTKRNEPVKTEEQLKAEEAVRRAREQLTPFVEGNPLIVTRRPWSPR